MNEILQLKGKFQQSPSEGRGGNPSLPKAANTLVESKHVLEIAGQIHDLKSFWQGINVIDGALIDVHYRQVIAKSNRIRALFANSMSTANSSIVGARFDSTGNHTITHHISEILLTDADRKLKIAAKIINDKFDGQITSDQLEKVESRRIDFSSYGISKSSFRQIVVDAYYVERFGRPHNASNRTHDAIVTLYKTDNDMRALLRKIGINIPLERFNGDATVLLFPDEMAKLVQNASYLIAMSVDDINSLVLDEESNITEREPWMISIDQPKEEPIIGVIDTQFDEDAYFHEWVEYTNMVDPRFGENKRHGTAVSSIIVDGPSINPNLDDGCGRFRVRHFGIVGNERMSSFGIMRDIKKIVETNTDIKVWNLSLGSEREVAESYISPEAAMLDELQKKHDIIFIVSGTNYLEGTVAGEKIIGSPADSINSIVVNAVDENGDPASYSRKGQVLSFFKKPDVCSFGGDTTGEGVKVCTPLGQDTMYGTSIAAPWITRKVAFLIEILGFSREVAKALIVDAAAEWNDTGNDPVSSTLLGYGVVPVHIDNVVRSKDNEIKFIIDIVSEDYDTYTYNLPVPTDNSKHPFIAKATLCYFPKCSINQGVDYTNTELDVYIGRIKKDGSKPGIKSIDKNVQSLNDGEFHPVNEETARKVFRKWDNTKHIREVIGDKIMPRKAYDDGLWGISVKTKNRFDADDGKNLKFGLIVTLSEMNGVNRIRDFIRLCELRGWLVNRVDVESRVEVYNKAQESITLDI